MKYNFCFRFLATCANQQHYKTSPHGVGWCFGGSVCTEQFLWRILDKKKSRFLHMHAFGKTWWGEAYIPCVTNLQALYAWVIRWQVTGMFSLAEHWHGRRALSNHVCAHSVISMCHMICLQYLARACSGQSRSTSVLPINHVIQIPQCLSGFVNHNYQEYHMFTILMFVYQMNEI